MLTFYNLVKRVQFQLQQKEPRKEICGALCISYWELNRADLLLRNVSRSQGQEWVST